MQNLPDTTSSSKTVIAPEATPAVRRKLTARVADLMADRSGMMPVWFRSPKVGPDPLCGFCRSKLYQLATDGLIRSVSIREPGQVKGTRLFHLQSILAYIEKCEANANVVVASTCEAVEK